MIFFVHFVTNKKIYSISLQIYIQSSTTSHHLQLFYLKDWNSTMKFTYRCVFCNTNGKRKNSYRNDVKQRWITNRWFHYFHWKLKAKEKLNHNSILSSHFAYLRKTRVPHLNSFNVFAFYRFLYSDLFRFNWETLNVFVGFDSIQDFVILLYHFPRV